jgi:hypothetical protein
MKTLSKSVIHGCNPDHTPYIKLRVQGLATI